RRPGRLPGRRCASGHRAPRPPPQADRTPAGTRLENIARFLDFVSEGITRAAEQARDILHTKPATTPDNTA
ncbi:hypothetical protein ACFW2G_32100, partial [Streptomyces sp. NPDC058880]